MVFILQGNIAHSLKFELISRKIGLVFFLRWNLIHMNCFIAKFMTATTVMTNNLCDVSKADCIARVYIILLSKL